MITQTVTATNGYFLHLNKIWFDHANLQSYYRLNNCLNNSGWRSALIFFEHNVNIIGWHKHWTYKILNKPQLYTHC